MPLSCSSPAICRTGPLNRDIATFVTLRTEFLQCGWPCLIVITQGHGAGGVARPRSSVLRRAGSVAGGGKLRDPRLPGQRTEWAKGTAQERASSLIPGGKGHQAGTGRAPWRASSQNLLFLATSPKLLRPLSSYDERGARSRRPRPLAANPAGPARLHRRLRQLGLLDGARLPRNGPGAYPSRARGSRRRPRDQAAGIPGTPYRIGGPVGRGRMTTWCRWPRWWRPASRTTLPFHPLGDDSSRRLRVHSTTKGTNGPLSTEGRFRAA